MKQDEKMKRLEELEAELAFEKKKVAAMEKEWQDAKREVEMSIDLGAFAGKYYKVRKGISMDYKYVYVKRATSFDLQHNCAVFTGIVVNIVSRAMHGPTFYLTNSAEHEIPYGDLTEENEIGADEFNSVMAKALEVV